MSCVLSVNGRSHRAARPAIKQASGRFKGRGDPRPRLKRRHRHLVAEAGVGGQSLQKIAERQRAFSRRQPAPRG